MERTSFENGILSLHLACLFPLIWEFIHTYRSLNFGQDAPCGKIPVSLPINDISWI